MNIIVQKFGGTSVATPELRERVTRRIIESKKKGYTPVVIVSAIGRKGDPYATDTLIGLVRSIYNPINQRELDLMMSCGEIISSVILSNTLKAAKCDACALTGGQAGIITDDNFGKSTVLKIEVSKLMETINKGLVPVICGFQGITSQGHFTTFGRGGSDYSAVIIAEALGCEMVEIYTDVDGIMTADPRLVHNAKVLSSASYTEVFQLAEQGAKVIHPKAVEVAMKNNIQLIIRNTMNDTMGTAITTYNTVPSAIRKESNLITSIAYIKNRVQVRMKFTNDEIENELLQRLAKNEISIDLINIFPDQMVFTIDGDDMDTAKKIMDNKNYDYELIEGCSKISVIGNRMHGVPGVMSIIVSTLIKNNIKILQTADSHITISCLVNDKDIAKAVNVLHDEFELWK